MATVLPINEEEKMSIIAGLRSRVPATKLVTLKKIADIADLRPESLQYLEMTDKRSMNEIIQSIEKICNMEQDEVIKREALISLEKVKKALGTKFNMELPLCNNCNQAIDLGWKYCTNCGSKIADMVFENVERCDNCKNYISESWIYCAHCSNLLKEEIETHPTCPKCKRSVDPSWMVCPYCGHRLKRVKP
ncbi:MAG TPA: zinc ribbon domain-containing protein [Methanothermococcus okinawensis]|uniref:Zinc ribbon domain-containing protein n=1 Tax=Methanothermococcus okinawensis TaxID=155863 RepID=A0A832YUN8_9EURY|nr:zinc ribbon domain-containing protein [Methanothermococcus okinawensis]